VEGGSSTCGRSSFNLLSSKFSLPLTSYGYTQLRFGDCHH
jgi:hypothetical protein